LKGIYPAKSLSRFADIIALCVQVPFLPDVWPGMIWFFSCVQFLQTWAPVDFLVFDWNISWCVCIVDVKYEGKRVLNLVIVMEQLLWPVQMWWFSVWSGITNKSHLWCCNMRPECVRLGWSICSPNLNSAHQCQN
jgi:hypothetical protein